MSEKYYVWRHDAAYPGELRKEFWNGTSWGGPPALYDTLDRAHDVAYENRTGQDMPRVGTQK